MLPSTEIERNQEYVTQLIENNKKQIGVSNLNRKVILKFSEKFENDSLNYLIDLQGNEGVKVGNVIKTLNESYVFIESDNDRYFAHFTNFLDFRSSAELKRIKEGQLVSFEEGHNTIGVCAKNVKILSN